ncbi:MAG TPA: NepR family anti-sigma factor [Burkholderiales bacterium]|nr:NepR family anti-sigma factor [Burkholderiales bacterium]
MNTPDDDELRRRVKAAYDPVLQEPVPDRLSALLEPPRVADLAAERERRAPRRFAALTWAQLGGMAASVLVGVLVGLNWPAGEDDALLVERGGNIVAGAPLARALDTRLAGDPAAAVHVQLTFVDRDGRYCRTFSAQQLAGLACRDAGQWSVVATARAERGAQGDMRQAASTLPRPVLEAVDARIAGAALDAGQERAARERGWVR